ncbi:MAG: hypothetical protein U0Z44_09535 [Kouleothrix sp.]
MSTRRSPPLTPGFSGADLANAVNEAAILSARCSLKKKTAWPSCRTPTSACRWVGPSAAAA